MQNIISGFRDGTVNVHGVKEGQYMRTLRPAAHELSFRVELVSVGHQGHVLFTGHNQESHSLHVFTLSGRHLSSVSVSHRITGTDTTAFRDSDIVISDQPR